MSFELKNRFSSHRSTISRNDFQPLSNQRLLPLRRSTLHPARRPRHHRTLPLQELQKVVRLVVSGELVRQARCTPLTANQAAWIFLTPRLQQLTFQSGEDKLSKYLDRNTDSGSAPLRMFCSICGSNFITTNDQSDFVRGHVIVMSGCLDGEVNFVPKQEFYCKDQCIFVDVKMRTEKFEGMT